MNQNIWIIKIYFWISHFEYITKAQKNQPTEILKQTETETP